jgi:hypothetical protein
MPTSPTPKIVRRSEPEGLLFRKSFFVRRERITKICVKRPSRNHAERKISEETFITYSKKRNVM